MAKCIWLKTISFINTRSFSTSSVVRGKRNFRCFPLYNFRGTREFKKRQQENPDPKIPIYTYGVRQPGITENKKFHLIPEMIPELIVPDLEGFELKPYVSYCAEEVYQSEFTAKDLFDAIYSKKIQEDFHNNKLDENGNPLEPNENEQLRKGQAILLARKTGSDLFE